MTRASTGCRPETKKRTGLGAHADAGDYDPIDARADEYTQHHLGDITA